MCFELDYYINLCLVWLYLGVVSLLFGNFGIDFVVVCEGIEGFYIGNGGVICVGMFNEVVIEVSVNIVFGVWCVVVDVFEWV